MLRKVTTMERLKAAVLAAGLALVLLAIMRMLAGPSPPMILDGARIPVQDMPTVPEPPPTKILATVVQAALTMVLAAVLATSLASVLSTIPAAIIAACLTPLVLSVSAMVMLMLLGAKSTALLTAVVLPTILALTLWRRFRRRRRLPHGHEYEE